MSADAATRRQALVAFLLYLAFVVYGSLVPFEYRALAWDQAIVNFRHIRYLDLGVVSRADWISNIVLYVPLAFLGCLVVLGMDRVGWPGPMGVALVAALCLMTAVGVEFTQQWFAPRTVSVNDLFAESIGTLIGIALWAFGRWRIVQLWDDFARGGRPSVLSALVAYALVYVVLALFPYDFVLSAQELRWKLASGNQGWLVAAGCGNPIRCAARLTLDALAVAPLGVFGALLWPRVSLGRWFAVGVLIGLVLEPLQLLLASGTSQGLSVVLRGVGLAVGAVAGVWLDQIGPRPVARVIVAAVPILVLPYLAGLALVNGWFSVPALSVDAALVRLPEVRWLPLYYHYFTSETVAMASALAQVALYAPLGLLAWAWGARRVGGQAASGRWLAAGAALAISLVIEGGKLFFPPKHPDPTNLIIALAGALVAYGLARWFHRVLTGEGRALGRGFKPGAAPAPPACPPSLAARRGFLPGMASIPGAQGAASGTTSSIPGVAVARGELGQDADDGSVAPMRGPSTGVADQHNAGSGTTTGTPTAPGSLTTAPSWSAPAFVPLATADDRRRTGIAAKQAGVLASVIATPPLEARASSDRACVQPDRGAARDPYTQPKASAARIRSRRRAGVSNAPRSAKGSSRVALAPSIRWVSRALGLGIGGCLIWLLARYPVAPMALGLALVIYAAALARWPRVWLLVIPAAMPALDLVPWSGWFYWECVDFFLAVTLMVPLLGVWRTAPPAPMPGAPLIAVLALSYALSLLHGLMPPTLIDANAFSSYWSPYNALRVAKGFVWALFLLPVARVTLTERAAFSNFLFPGLVLGFLGVMAALLQERQAFSGLLNFTNEFRVTASFSSMHTGGGHIEAYLSLVLPFILIYLLITRAAWVPVAGGLLLALAGYGLAVTFARAALIGLSVGLVIVALGVVIYLLRSRSRHWARHAGMLMLGLVALGAVALPIMKGGYFKERLAQVERDLQTRSAHWKDAIRMMTTGATTTLLGMGLGQFPLTYLLAHSKPHPVATYRFGGDANDHFLTLTAGDSLYYEQIVPIQPHRPYRIELDLRTRNLAPRLNLPICAKSLLYSYNCEWLGVNGIQGDGEWHRYRVDFNSGDLGSGPWYSRRPTKLSLYYSAGGEGIDVDNISLVAAGEGELLRNGNFAAANAHWFFSTDNHLPWHAKQLGVAVYFEQGLFGATAFVLFVGFVLQRLSRTVLRGDLIATGFLAGLAGFLAIGLFDSMFDAPRLTFLFYFLCLCALLLPEDVSDDRGT